MHVFINNKLIPLNGNSNLFAFLQEINIDISRGVAIAVNDIMIPRMEWDKTGLKDNDKITIIKAAAGG